MSDQTFIGADLTQTGAYWWFDLAGNVTPLSCKVDAGRDGRLMDPVAVGALCPKEGLALVA